MLNKYIYIKKVITEKYLFPFKFGNELTMSLIDSSLRTVTSLMNEQACSRTIEAELIYKIVLVSGTQQSVLFFYI